MSDADAATVAEADLPTSRSIGRDSLWVAAGTASSRVTGFARVFALAYAVGQGRLADTFTKANIAPNLVFELVIGGVLSATLVPVFVAAREHRDDDSASAVLSVGFVASAVLSLLALAITWVVDRIWAITTAELLYLLLPQILFYGITSLATAYLNAARRYRTAAFSPVLTNLVCIAAYVIVGIRLQGEDAILAGKERSFETILWLGLGTTAGIVAMTIPMMIAVRRTSGGLAFSPDWRHAAVRKVVRMSGWTLGYVIANQLALLAVVALVPDAKRYSDAFIFFQLPHGLIAVTIMTTMTPELSRAAARADYQRLTDQFARGLRLLAVLILPAAVGYVLLATPITSFLVRGNLSAADAVRTAHVVAAFAIGLPAFSTYLFACRGFYAMSDTRTPFVLNVLENGLNVVALLVLVGVGAASSTSFAFAYSGAYVLAAALALARLERAIRAKDPSVRRPALSPIGRMAAAALAMGLAVFLLRLVFDADRGPAAVVGVGLSVVVGAVVYGAAGAALGVTEIRAALDQIRSRVGA